MKKYFIVARNALVEVTTYRFNFLMWRVRAFFILLATYFFWESMIPGDTIIFGYNQSLILTYVFGVTLVSFIVMSSQTNGIGDEINRGDLSNYLLKPINYFYYWFARDLGDKVVGSTFTAIELTAFYFIVKPPLFLQTDPLILGLTLLSLVFSVVLFFLFSMLLGFVGFWSPEVWAPRFVFFVILSFFAGQFFPLDILPTAIFNLFKLLPFAYMLYFPIKVYLGQLALVEIYAGIMTSFVWTFLIYFIVRYVWTKGLKIYTAQGR